MPKIKTIALFSKPGSAQAWGALQEVVFWCRGRGVEVLFDEHAWDGRNWAPEFCERVRAQAEVALAIGGDGTLLGVARSLFGWSGALLGVNLGTLGFLTDVPANAIEPALTRLLEGTWAIEERILLEATLQRPATEPLPGALAFNDVVLSKGDHGQLMTFDVFVNEAPLYRLRADGLILATPTGSTAYSLSANGPILHPALNAMALVPLCPHSLTARPITLPSSAKVHIVVQGPVTGRVHCDGQPYGPLLSSGDALTVSQASTPVRMLHLEGYSEFESLREKLGWASARREG